MVELIKEHCKKQGIIYKAVLEITQRCNLRCAHCIIGKHKFEEISKEKVFNLINQLILEGTLFITITGGEPLLHKDFEEIYIHLKKNGFIIDIKTNGLLINEDIISLFNKYPPNMLAITVYGLNDSEYKDFTGDSKGFKKLVKALELLDSSGIIYKMTMIPTKKNFKSVVDGNYDIFFEKHGMELEMDYDILTTNSLQTYPLNYKVELNQMLQLEMRNKNYIKKIKSDYINIKNNKINILECEGGIGTVFIDSHYQVHTCFYDNQIGFSLERNHIAFIKQSLRSRNQEIQLLYHNSDCASCKTGIGCQRCPLINYRRTLNANDRNNCTMSQLRIKNLVNTQRIYISPSIEEYPGQVLELSFNVKNLGISKHSDYESFLFHDSLTKVEYSIDKYSVHGNIGKSVFYIPIVSEQLSKRINVKIGRGLKIFKHYDSDNTATYYDTITELFKMNQRIHSLGLGPEVFRILMIKSKRSFEIFHESKIYRFPKDSLFFAFEVEHLISKPLEPEKNLFNGHYYNGYELLNSINNFFTQIGIVTNDLGTQNLINTDQGIKFVDFFGWYET